nr:50s ribosomal protein l27, putative [Toxoplasma gondii RH]
MGRSSLAFVASACFLLCVSVPVSRLGVASVIVGQPDTAQHSRQFAFGFCVKKFGGEFVLPGHILVRQRGTRYKAGDGVRLCRDDSLTAVRSGYVDFLPVYKFEYHFRKRRWLKRHRRRVHAGFLVSVLDSMEESRGHQKRQELVLLRTLASSWVNGHTFSPAVPSLEEERVRIDEQGSDFSEFSVHESMQGQRRAAADGTEGLLADSVESENRGVNALDKGLLLGATHV